MDENYLKDIRERGKMLLRRGKELENNGQLEEALVWMFKAKKIMNEHYQDNYIQNRNLMKRIGFCLHNLNRVNEAYYFLSIYIKLQKYTENSNVIITKLHSLAGALFSVAFYLKDNMKNQKAIRKFQKFINISKKYFASDRGDLAIAYNNIAALLRDEGKLEESINYYNKCKQI